ALSETRALGEAVGSYVTTATATGAALSNYSVTYVAGSFSITTAAATVTAGGGTRAYGTTDPTLRATATGFTAADALTVTLSETRAPEGAVEGKRETATATGAAVGNYSVTYVAGSFSITQATATVTAGGGTKAYGTTDPA